MGDKIYAIWLIALAILFIVGPIVVFTSKRLFNKIHERNPNWVPVQAGRVFVLFNNQGYYWLKIFAGKYDDLDSDLRKSCRTFRFLSIVYFICLAIGMAGQIYFIINTGILGHPI